MEPLSKAYNFGHFVTTAQNPFEVGEEVIFHHNGREVEGIVLDVGWYRTTIRSFAREVFVIPNSVFSRTVVLNVTRKNGEWRFYEFLHLRPEDVDKARDIVADMRKWAPPSPLLLPLFPQHDCNIYITTCCAYSDVLK
jgi:MscS family membrane protein